MFPISAVSGQGLKPLLYYVREMLEQINEEPTVFEREYFPENVTFDEPFTVEKDEDSIFVVEGPRILRMLGYTNLESEKGFDFSKNSLRRTEFWMNWKPLAYRKVIPCAYMTFSLTIINNTEEKL